MRLLDSSLKLENLQGLIRTLGPDSAFKRGFSITMTTDGKIIRSSKDAESGMRLRTKLIDGEISSTIP
jgi:exodeoxyribonuclease VII large subunit